MKQLIKQTRWFVFLTVMMLISITQIHAGNLINTQTPWIPNTKNSTTTNADGSVTMTRPNERGYKFLFMRLSQTGRSGALTRDLVAGEKITVKIRAKSSSTKTFIYSKYLDFPRTNFTKVNEYEDFTFETIVKPNISKHSWLGLFLNKTGDTLTVKSIEILDGNTPPEGTELITGGAQNNLDTSKWTLLMSEGAINKDDCLAGKQCLLVNPFKAKAGMYQAIPTEEGKTYKVTASLIGANHYKEINNYTLGSSYITVDHKIPTVSDTSDEISRTVIGNTPTTVEITFTAVGTTSYISLRGDTGYRYPHALSISVKETGVRPPSKGNLVILEKPWIPNTKNSTKTNPDGSVTMTRPNTSGYKFLFIRLSQTGRGGALSRDLIAGEKITVKIRAKSSSTKSYIYSKFLDTPVTHFTKENVYQDFIFETTVKSNISKYAWLGLFTTQTGDTVTVKSIEILEKGDTPPPTDDTTPPTITLKGTNPVNLKVGDDYTESGATAIDDVDGDVSASILIGGDAVDTNIAGTYIITYTASDEKENKSTKNRTVIVKANVEPIDGGPTKESAVAINVNEDLILRPTYSTSFNGKPQREAWYRFEVLNTSNVTITYTAPDDGGSYIDISGKKTNWTGPGTTANVGPITLEAGTHYIYINKEGDEIQNIDFKITLTGTTPTKGAKIFVIGDSTVHNHDKEDGGYPLKGWADSLGEYMIHPENLYNRARSGASSKSYKIEDTRLGQYDWPETKRLIEGMDISQGAYLLIQFGHNDANTKPHLHTEPGIGNSFYNHLKEYVDYAKANKVIPVLITPLERQFVGRYTHGAYPQTVRDLARIENILLLDLTEKSYTEFNKYPSDKAIHNVFGYTYKTGRRAGEEDHTHLTVESSKIVAGWIRDLGCELSDKGLCNQFKPSNNLGGNIFEINFNKYQNKTEYTKDMLEKDFGKSENDGIGHDGLANASLVKDGTDTVFKVTYKENTFGPENGFQAAVFLNKVQSGQTVTLEYSFKFDQNFDWAEGGKLPGLAGGSMPTGGQLLNASSLLNTGFSDRFVWHKNGGIHHYIYHPEQIEAYQGDKQAAWKCIKVIKDGTPKVYGIGPYLVDKNVDQYTDINIASLMLNNNNPDGQCVYRPKYNEMIENKITFSKNKWYKIRQSIKPNNKGNSDGTIDIWIDDNLVSSIQGVKLIADNKEYKIDRLLFSTFYGGGSEDYAPERDTSIYFKNIKIFTK